MGKKSPPTQFIRELILYSTCPLEAFQDDSEFPTLQDQCLPRSRPAPASRFTQHKWRNPTPSDPTDRHLGSTPFSLLCMSKGVRVQWSLSEYVKHTDNKHTNMLAHVWKGACLGQRETSSWCREEFRKHVSETMGLGRVLLSHFFK